MKKLLILAALTCLIVTTSFSQTSSNQSKHQYLLIFRFKSNFTPQSQDAVQDNIRHWQEYMGNLGKMGILASGFRPTNEGRTITGTNKKIKDGAYIVNNELISSFIIINAVSIEEASEIAKKCPIFEFDGSVEIRPIMQTAN